MFFIFFSETNIGFIYSNTYRGDYEKQKNYISHVSQCDFTDNFATDCM